MARLHRIGNLQRLCFITCVTASRRPLLLGRPELFLKCWRTIQPMSWVVMPDHFHAILAVDTEPLSTVVHRFKVKYAWHLNDPVSIGKIWQNRFWDHWIRDEADLARHMDYVHRNPVHHGFVTDPFEWEYSSLVHWFEQGYYSGDWGQMDNEKVQGEYGE